MFPQLSCQCPKRSRWNILPFPSRTLSFANSVTRTPLIIASFGDFFILYCWAWARALRMSIGRGFVVPVWGMPSRNSAHTSSKSASTSYGGASEGQTIIASRCANCWTVTQSCVPGNRVSSRVGVCFIRLIRQTLPGLPACWHFCCCLAFLFLLLSILRPGLTARVRIEIY